MDMLICGQRSGGGSTERSPFRGLQRWFQAGEYETRCVLAAEGDVVGTTGSDYLAVPKLLMQIQLFDTNYLTLNHAGNSKTNFFNSSIFPVLPQMQKQPDFTKQYGS
jgi:hypothetical protein